MKHSEEQLDWVEILEEEAMDKVKEVLPFEYNNYSGYSNQELKCLIAKHGDVKAQLDKEIWEVGNKLFCMIEELKKRSGGVDE